LLQTVAVILRRDVVETMSGPQQNHVEKNSLRVQRYLDSAEHCEELASAVIDHNAKAGFLKAAGHWRELARQIEDIERKRSALVHSNGKHYWVR
jgi:hypothetical protein